MPPAAAPENIYTGSNMLSVPRILMTPRNSYRFIHRWYRGVLVLLAFAGMNDLIDGCIAHKYNMGTLVGSIVDPLADRFVMTTLVSAIASIGGMRMLMALIHLELDFALGLSALYWRSISPPTPYTFTRFWDLSLLSASSHPTSVSKLHTGLQIVLVSACMVQPVLPVDTLSLYEYSVASATKYFGLEHTWRK
ncbi:hypothetical protein BCR37DRAFT_352333, partial [Protomyces lactucae-debilis]